MKKRGMAGWMIAAIIVAIILVLAILGVLGYQMFKGDDSIVDPVNHNQTGGNANPNIPAGNVQDANTAPPPVPEGFGNNTQDPNTAPPPVPEGFGNNTQDANTAPPPVPEGFGNN